MRGMPGGQDDPVCRRVRRGAVPRVQGAEGDSQETEQVMTITIDRDIDESSVIYAVVEAWSNRINASLDAQAREMVRDAIDRLLRDKITAIVDAEIARVVADGWQATNAYGEPTDNKKTIKERIADELTRKGYNQGKPYRRVEQIAAETIESALRSDFQKEIDDLRSSFRAALDGQLKDKLTGALKTALGL